MKLKILVISYKFYPDVGGIEVNTEILCSKFAQMGAEVCLITTTREPGKRNFPFMVIRNPTMLKLLRAHSWADVVFENNVCLTLSWPNIFLRKPLIVAIRTWISRVDGRISIVDRLKYLWLNRAKKVIAVSNAIREQCWAEAIVIGNPYRNELFKEYENFNRNGFVFVGRLVSDKGVDMAIKALYRLSTKGEFISCPDVKLGIIGDGPELENLKKLVRELKLDYDVTFLGQLKGEKLVTTLNQYKFLLVPSKWKEPFGNVALEGLACGLFPIVSDGGGLPDAVGNAGLVFKRNDIEDLIRVMTSVLSGNDKYSQLIKNRFSHLYRHDPSFVARKYLDVIRESL